MRVAIELSENRSDCKIRPAVRYSNTGETWDAYKVVDPTWLSTESTAYPPNFVVLENISGLNARTYFQFGVEVDNNSTQDFTMCNATIRLEFKD